MQHRQLSENEPRCERKKLTGDLPIATINKLNIRVYVCSTPSAPRNDGIRHHGDLVLALLHRAVRVQDEAKGNFRLVEK